MKKINESQFSHTRIKGFDIKHDENSDGWVGYFDIEYPSADGNEFGTKIVNNFKVQGNQISWEHQMPEAQKAHMERIIIKKINNMNDINNKTKLTLNESQLVDLVSEVVKKYLKEAYDAVDYKNTENRPTNSKHIKKIHPDWSDEQCEKAADYFYNKYLEEQKKKKQS